jgi:hypothetical protein
MSRARRRAAGRNSLIRHFGAASRLWKTGCMKINSRASSMFRFDHLIRADMIVRDVKQRYPQTVELFEGFGFRSACDDCDIETGARRNGLNTLDVVEALNRAAFGRKADPQ